jgi:hypothetical protein
MELKISTRFEHHAVAVLCCELTGQYLQERVYINLDSMYGQHRTRFLLGNCLKKMFMQ